MRPHPTRPAIDTMNSHRRRLLLRLAALGGGGSLMPAFVPRARAQDAVLGSAPALFTAGQDSLCDFDWAVHYGDEADLQVAEVQGPAWKPINLGIAWEGQGMRNGEITWLRKDVLLPPELRGRVLRLCVRMVAVEVTVYCNGRLVGRNKAAGQPAEFHLPPSALKWGQPNRLALRVDGHWWTGGVNEDIVKLLTNESPAAVDVREVLAPADHIFPIESDAAFDLRIESRAGDGVKLHLDVEVVSDFHAPIFARSSLVQTRGGVQACRFNLGRLQPGFYQVIARYSQAGRHGQHVFWFGVAPTLIEPVHNRPADFEDYWQRALGELSRVRPEFKIVLDEGRSTPTHRVYSVEMASFDDVTVRAWYIVPSKPGRHAAVLNVPGYSVAQNPEWFQEDDDIIHLALDVRGQGRSTDVINPGFGIPGLFGYRINDPEHYVYKGMYLDCGRALEFLSSRPEVDSSRIAVAGGSQGGGLALASAALYPDIVKACIAGSPYLGDFSDHMRIRDVYRWELQGHVDRLHGLTWDHVYRAMSLVDTVNLAPRIRCPVLMGTGLFDDDCPPHIGFAVFNEIYAPKDYLVYPKLGHMLWTQWEMDSKLWMRRHFQL